MAQAETAANDGSTADENTEAEDTEVFAVQVELRQTATIPVRAKSRADAWDALEMPHTSRDLQRYFARKDFQGAHYEPEDVFGNENPSEAHIDATGSDLEVVVDDTEINSDRR
ncbi:hypothetical protein EXE44_04805 [Halorubrum sp. SS7]|uniref:hypothetical protein n=1 Tax=Halorubrum sp. SS7 TaxID=2518119 RepID=UPI0010F49BD9|nr:hypothetical protein [Halorubrum sp. SS7]TKX58866.1 hypothetical protein EXE44_04805 [Halorubrum sp. SS7]